MKMYLIAVVVALLGLWVSTAAQAKDYCGLRSATVLGVKDWRGEVRGDKIQFTVMLKSGHDKAIRAVGGTVEFVGRGMQSVMRIQIRLAELIEAKGEAVIASAEPATEANKRLLAMARNNVHVIACVDSVEFADGSGVIIN